jgi:hypothetical protein
MLRKFLIAAVAVAAFGAVVAPTPADAFWLCRKWSQKYGHCIAWRWVNDPIYRPVWVWPLPWPFFVTSDPEPLPWITVNPALQRPGQAAPR